MSLFDDLISIAVVGSVGTIAIVGLRGNTATQPSTAATPAAQSTQVTGNAAKWFATSQSIGSAAIGMAEGNYALSLNGNEVQIRNTRLHGGHIDPGNFVKNYGWCSDQGRSGGDLAKADRLCLERTAGRLPIIIADLKAAGINPDTDAEALINAADLYNQASPVHSRRFPAALAKARKDGKTGTEAIIHARTASFYNEAGRNEAGGLLGICRRENRPVTEWGCVEHDQGRRAKQIARTLQVFAAAGATEGRRAN